MFFWRRIPTTLRRYYPPVVQIPALPCESFATSGKPSTLLPLGELVEQAQFETVCVIAKICAQKCTFSHSGCLWELLGRAGASETCPLSAVEPSHDCGFYTISETQLFVQLHRVNVPCSLPCMACSPSGVACLLPSVSFHITRVLPGSTCPPRGN